MRDNEGNPTTVSGNEIKSTDTNVGKVGDPAAEKLEEKLNANNYETNSEGEDEVTEVGNISSRPRRARKPVKSLFILN